MQYYILIEHMNNCSYVQQSKETNRIGLIEKGGDCMALNDVQQCENYETHPDLISTISSSMPDEDEIYDLAELFKVFGDSTRMRILFALFQADICVCDLAETLGMTQSAVSHQLKILKQAKLVKNRREGKQVIYFLADDHVRTIIEVGREHIEEL